MASWLPVVAPAQNVDRQSFLKERPWWLGTVKSHCLVVEPSSKRPSLCVCQLGSSLFGIFKEETNHQAAQYNLSAISGPLGALIRHRNPSAFQFTGLCKNCGKKVKRVKRRPVGNFRQAPPLRGTYGQKSAKKRLRSEVFLDHPTLTLQG